WEHAFPTVLAQCQAHGFDPRTQPLPVQPAAHFHMGGIAVDLDGRSTVPGLYAVGEVACNGLHGANRLASNSLLEGVVFGRRVGAHAAQTATDPLRRRTLWIADPGAALEPEALARLRHCVSDALGPLRARQRINAAREFLSGDANLAASAQGKVALAMLEAAAVRRESLGAHHWEVDAAISAGA
ncbi:MAG: FAD-binding protein, partial [Xanthomonadales bacterium]|nr:FAD-binding protein [Xanthomonadales bacterium]